MNRFDEMFTNGLETMIAESGAIVAGPVLHFAKEVKEQSQGSAPIPVTWVITGQVESPETLKGEMPIVSLHLRREERSPFLPPPVPVPSWEAEYSPWQPDDKAVVFLGKMPSEILLVLPSGTGNRDLISLVRLIVSHYAMDPVEQANAWRKHLHNGVKAVGESKRIALRSLMKLTTNWSEEAPTLYAVMRDGDSDLRRYAYGIVAHAIVNEKWSDASESVKFLCTQFEKETDARIADNYREYVNLVLQFTNVENFRPQRKALNEQLRNCLKDR